MRWHGLQHGGNDQQLGSTTKAPDWVWYWLAVHNLDAPHNDTMQQKTFCWNSSYRQYIFCQYDEKSNYLRSFWRCLKQVHSEHVYYSIPSTKTARPPHETAQKRVHHKRISKRQTNNVSRCWKKVNPNFSLILKWLETWCLSKTVAPGQTNKDLMKKRIQGWWSPIDGTHGDLGIPWKSHHATLAGLRAINWQLGPDGVSTTTRPLQISWASCALKASLVKRKSLKAPKKRLPCFSRNKNECCFFRDKPLSLGKKNCPTKIWRCEAAFMRREGYKTSKRVVKSGSKSMVKWCKMCEACPN